MEMADKSIKPTADPDKIYWINQFPNYFRYGYFEIPSRTCYSRFNDNKTFGWKLENG